MGSVAFFMSSRWDGSCVVEGTRFWIIDICFKWRINQIIIPSQLLQCMPPKRQIKKTVVHYAEDIEAKREAEDRDRERSREKARVRQEKEDEDERQKQYGGRKQEEVKVEQINILSRRERLEMMRRAQREQQQFTEIPLEVQVKIEQPQVPVRIEQQPIQQHPPIIEETSKKNPSSKVKKQQNHSKNSSSDDQNDESQEQDGGRVVLNKPIFISKSYREPTEHEGVTEEQRRRRSIKYTTKLLLEQNKYANSEEENHQTDSQFENQTDIPNDDDTINEEYEFELWKIRELKRIRRTQEEHRKYELEKQEIDRRRQMSNQQILIENRALGSDSTENNEETKYVFMQKYYHKGAFYQDSEDEIFKRDYNLPTPMEMQDKSMLPKLLQKRIGNFGKKGQSKYTHLTNEDTSDLNPLTRPDEALLDYWKKRTAGYKGSYNSNV